MLVLRSTWRRYLLALFGGVLLLPLQAQQIPSKRTLNVAQRAAIAFRGTVLAVEHVPPTTQNGVGTMRVTFRADEGIRGVRTGEQFTISEWDGLWTAGERYRVGETLQMYLHAPSALGLTSPVGGEQGRITIQNPGRRAGGRRVPRASTDRRGAGRQRAGE